MLGQLRADAPHGGMGKAARPVSGTRPGRRASSACTTASRAPTSRRCPRIAALIDKDQFELITSPESGMVVIQGGAGSGKTTVALHRVAYLNFQDPRRFKASNVLFVVPSQALVRYVAGVLPALGVGGVPVVTYAGWARTTRMRCLPEAPAKYNVEPPDQVSRVKKHPAMLGVLANWVVRQAAEIGAEIAALDAAAGAEWERLAKRRSLMSRLSGLSSWTKKTELESSVRVSLEGAIKRWRRRADDCILDWAELMTDPALVLGEGLSTAPTSRSATCADASSSCGSSASSRSRRPRRSTTTASRSSTPRARRWARTRMIPRAASTAMKTIRCCCASCSLKRGAR